MEGRWIEEEGRVGGRDASRKHKRHTTNTIHHHPSTAHRPAATCSRTPRRCGSTCARAKASSASSRSSTRRASVRRFLCFGRGGGAGLLSCVFVCVGRWKWGGGRLRATRGSFSPPPRRSAESPRSPTHTNTHQHTPTHTNTHQHTPTHTNTHQHTPTHTNTHTHTYTRHTPTHHNTTTPTCTITTSRGRGELRGDRQRRRRLQGIVIRVEWRGEWCGVDGGDAVEAVGAEAGGQTNQPQPHQWTDFVTQKRFSFTLGFFRRPFISLSAN